jgi:hypothetical protein
LGNWSLSQTCLVPTGGTARSYKCPATSNSQT